MQRGERTRCIYSSGSAHSRGSRNLERIRPASPSPALPPASFFRLLPSFFSALNRRLSPLPERAKERVDTRPGVRSTTVGRERTRSLVKVRIDLSPRRGIRRSRRSSRTALFVDVLRETTFLARKTRRRCFFLFDRECRQSNYQIPSREAGNFAVDHKRRKLIGAVQVIFDTARVI